MKNKVFCMRCGKDLTPRLVGGIGTVACKPCNMEYMLYPSGDIWVKDFNIGCAFLVEAKKYRGES